MKLQTKFSVNSKNMKISFFIKYLVKSFFNNNMAFIYFSYYRNYFENKCAD